MTNAPFLPTTGSTTGHTLDRLAEVVRARRTATSDGSYTRQLLDAGTEKCARKFGEEAVELIIASIGQDTKSATSEAADVLYHLLVLLEARNIRLADVLGALDARMATSGIVEKASRPKG
jgi:phosphoribosyl-ATP pyrophosphohydrolase